MLQAEIPSAPYPVNTTFFTHLDSTGMQTLGQDSLPFALYPYNVTGNQPEQVNLGVYDLIKHAPEDGPAIQHQHT